MAELAAETAALMLSHPGVSATLAAASAVAMTALVLGRIRSRRLTHAIAPGESWAERVGEAGERLVACELSALGWPVLHNVVLIDRGASAEIDHLVRAPDGIVVLETKTYSGFVTGSEDAPYWTHYRRDGQEFPFLNPAFQNLAHVRAVERVIGDAGVYVRGFVVSAGSAKFAEAIARIPIPLRALRVVRQNHVRLGMPGQDRIDAAWRRLAVEAGQSPCRRAAHGAYVEYRRSARRRAF